MIYDPFRVTDYADFFSVLFVMTTFRNSIFESLYRLRIRESDQLKTVVELYDMEIVQKISMPNYHKLKTMVEEGCRSETSITKL